MSNVIVSIGRNIDSIPMPDQDWAAFRKAVRSQVDALGVLNIWFEGMGAGAYQSATATMIHEESYTIIAELAVDADPTAFEVGLADLAAMFQQESIAVTYATPKFVEAQFA